MHFVEKCAQLQNKLIIMNNDSDLNNYNCVLGVCANFGLGTE